MKNFLEFISTVLLNLIVLVWFLLMMAWAFVIMYGCYFIIKVCLTLLFA